MSQSNPCLHEGTCVVRYDVTDINVYFCICTDGFEGDYCQSRRRRVDITIFLSSKSMFETADVRAATISYSYVDSETFQLSVRYQQVFETLPLEIQLIYDYRSYSNPRSIALMKVYGSNYHSGIAKYSLLYLNLDPK